MNKLLILVLGIQCYSLAWSQVDSVTLLQTINIRDRQFTELFQSEKIVKYDSLYRVGAIAPNLGDLLSKKGFSFVKSYGQMQLQSLSVGGLGANQTAISWDGIPLNDPMLGTVDLSLLPIGNFNDITLITIGTATMSGGNSLGGTVSLNTDLHFNDINKITVGSDYNTLNNWQNNLSFQYSNEKFVTKNSIVLLNGKNHVRYRNIVFPNQVVDTVCHADYYGLSTMSNHLIKLAKDQLLQINLWYQKYDRNIPPTIYEAKSDANEYDEQFRSLVTYNWRHAYSNTTVKLAAFKTFMWYNDSIKLIDSHNSTTSYYIQASNKWVLRKSAELFVRGEWQKLLINTNNYLSAKQRNTMALVAGYKQPFLENRIKTNWSVRTENVDERFSPVVFNAGIDIKITKEISAKLHFARNYRLPTLNDLFWYPYGNTELKPEQGYGYQCGLVYRLEKSKWQGEVSVTGFNNRATNLILWKPVSSTFWQPINIGKVNAYGLMNDWSVSYKTKQWFVKLDADYTFTRSLNNDTNDIDYGKQMIYIPENQMRINLFVGFKRFLFSINQQAISKTFTVTDNSGYLEGYFLTNIGLSKEINLNPSSVKIAIGIDNLFNADYQVMLNRPMPLRYYKISIQLTLK